MLLNLHEVRGKTIEAGWDWWEVIEVPSSPKEWDANCSGTGDRISFHALSTLSLATTHG